MDRVVFVPRRAARAAFALLRAGLLSSGTGIILTGSVLALLLRIFRRLNGTRNIGHAELGTDQAAQQFSGPTGLGRRTHARPT